MNAGARAALWGRLRRGGLVAGECPVASAPPAPWYVRTMLGIAGWIAAAFLLGFVAIAISGIMRNGAAALTVGIVVCAGAIAMLWVRSRQEFFTQFALAASLAGQALVVFGLLDVFPSRDPFVLIVIAAFEGALLPLAPNAVHRTWSAIVAAVALIMGLYAIRAPFLVPGLATAAFVLLQFAELRFAAHASVSRAASAGVAIALLAAGIAAPLLDLGGWFGRSNAMPGTAWSAYAAVLAGVVLVGTVASLLAREGAVRSRTGLAAILASIALAAAAWTMPGVIAGVAVAVAAFAAGRMALTGLGLLHAAAAIGYYYYSLASPLLTKALSLLAASVVLLAAWYAARQLLGTPEPEMRDA